MKNSPLCRWCKSAVPVAVLAASALVSVGAHAVPVDLSSWTANGNGDWVLQSGNDAVRQTLNSPPTIFHNGLNSQGTLLKGTIEVQTTGDDDFVGFVLGYQDGELFNDTAEYYLVDWKQNDQSGADAGMAFSRVSGDAGNGVGGTDTTADLWDHGGVVSELARANTLGSTGWADNTEFAFEILFRSSNIQVFIDDVLEFDIDDSFSDGAFGFYNFSQQDVLYAGIQEDVAPPPSDTDIPEPAALAIFAFGLTGIGFAMRRRRRL